MAGGGSASARPPGCLGAPCACRLRRRRAAGPMPLCVSPVRRGSSSYALLLVPGAWCPSCVWCVVPRALCPTRLVCRASCPSCVGCLPSGIWWLPSDGWLLMPRARVLPASVLLGSEPGVDRAVGGSSTPPTTLMIELRFSERDNSRNHRPCAYCGELAFAQVRELSTGGWHVDERGINPCLHPQSRDQPKLSTAVHRLSTAYPPGLYPGLWTAPGRYRLVVPRTFNRKSTGVHRVWEKM